MSIKKNWTIGLSSILAASLFALPMHAQESDNSDDADSEVEQIVVTGSRIVRPNFDQAAPIVTVTADEIGRFGTPDLGTILGELPAVGSGGTLRGNSGSNALAGVSSANLRNLGLARTLTLVDGRRHVAAVAGSSQVDIGTIPAALVERVDIVTGGASAVYGSDAVAGVVNVITKSEYEGFDFTFTGADSLEDVNAQNYSATITAGMNFANDRGNITVFGGTDQIEQVLGADIRQFSDFGTILNPDDTGETDGIPDRLSVPNVLLEVINSNTVLNPFGGGDLITFLDDGRPVDQIARTGTNSFAFGSFPGGCITCFSLESEEDILPELDKVYAGFQANYDITDSLNAYGSFKYVQSDIVQRFQAGFRFGNIFINVNDNPYLDAGLRQRLLDAGQTNVRAARFFSDIGTRSANNDRQLIQYALGVKGDFNLGANEFDYDVSYTNGRSKNSRITQNDLIPGNIAAALDAVVDPVSGNIICRGGATGNPGTVNPEECAPFNPFGFGQSSQASRDFISAPNLRDDDIEQQVLLATVASDTSAFLNLPAGPIGYVLGFEYRDEQSSTVTDALSQSGNLLTAATPDTGGSFDVDEFFVEANLPILSDATFAEDLSLGFAYRSADYTHAGSADAWKVDLQWTPIESVTFRGTIGDAVRAPNLDEAFSARSPGFANVNDPCDTADLPGDVDRAANCAALGIPAGFVANDNVSIMTISGGNPNLKSEESESATGGIVWRPTTFLEGLSVSLDYYDIEIGDAILLVGAQDIVNNCVDGSGGLDPNFCASITRDPTTFDIVTVESGFINAASFTTSGFDFNATYRDIQLDTLGVPGSLDVNLFVNVLKELDFFEFQNLPLEIDPEKGQVGNPDFQARLTATYNLNDLSVNWATRLIDRSFQLDIDGQGNVIPEDLDFPFVGTIATHDLSIDYDFNDNYRIYGGIRNLGDKVPPGIIGNSIYDIIGRRAFIGFNASF